MAKKSCPFLFTKRSVSDPNRNSRLEYGSETKKYTQKFHIAIVCPRRFVQFYTMKIGLFGPIVLILKCFSLQICTLDLRKKAS